MCSIRSEFSTTGVWLMRVNRITSVLSENPDQSLVQKGFKSLARLSDERVVNFAATRSTASPRHFSIHPRISFYASALRTHALAPAPETRPWACAETEWPRRDLKQTPSESTWCEESREVLMAVHTALAGPPTAAQLALLDHLAPPFHLRQMLQ